MNLLISATLSLCLLPACASAPTATAASNADLRAVVAGWALGNWAEVHGSRLDAQTGEWVEVGDESPWKRWDIVAIAPDTVELRIQDRAVERMALRDGAYRALGLSAVNAATDDAGVNTIVEANVASPREWRLLMQWPPSDDLPAGQLSFSELSMAGDVFVWSNWVGPSREELQRISISVNRIKR